jgi:CRP-like cAMP-binding protein
MYLILEGEVRVRVMRRSKESILATLRAGDFFGEVSLLDEGPRSADVIANERSTLLKISTVSFARLRREAPALAEPFLHALNKSWSVASHCEQALCGFIVDDASAPSARGRKTKGRNVRAHRR